MISLGRIEGGGPGCQNEIWCSNLCFCKRKQQKTSKFFCAIYVSRVDRSLKLQQNSFNANCFNKAAKTEMGLQHKQELAKRKKHPNKAAETFPRTKTLTQQMKKKKKQKKSKKTRQEQLHKKSNNRKQQKKKQKLKKLQKQGKEKAKTKIKELPSNKKMQHRNNKKSKRKVKKCPWRKPDKILVQDSLELMVEQ